jgi:AraC-like DNA-binding protein
VHRRAALLGDRAYEYDASKYLVVSLDLPIVGSVIEASPARPYLCFALDIDVAALGELMLEREPAPRAALPPAIGVSATDPGLLDAVARLLRLLDTPADAPVLAPLAEREILYRLMTGEQAEMMRHIAGADTRLARISRAIAWLKDHYDGPCSVEALADAAGMSPSTFHQHFKAVTTMSPLQYRTQLRLQAARRLMIVDNLDAASAGFRVGYDSPSQFSRDYRRAFGAPPVKDVARLRGDITYAMVA